MTNIKVRMYRILRWSEKYTKTDMVYLMSGSFFLGTGYIFTAFISFIVTIVFGYYLSKDAYGDYRYVISIFALLSAFTLTGINTAMIQSVARGYDGALKQGVKLNFKLSYIAVTGALIGSLYYFYNANSFLGISLIIIAISIPLLHSFGYYSSFINGKRDYLRLSICNLINSAVPSLGAIGALIFTKNILFILVVYFGTNILINVFLYFLTLHHYKPSSVEDPGLKNYSLKLSALNIINIITAHIDKVIVYTSLGAVELAVYGFATTFPDQIRFLLKNLSTLMIPKFTENNLKNRRTNLIYKSIQLGLLMFTLMIMYIWLAPFLYSIFFPKYPESVYFSRIISLMLLSSVAMIPLSIFIAEKKEDKLAKATIGGSLFQIAILIPSAHFWGLTGVAISKVLGSYVTTAISYYLTRDHSKKIDTYKVL